MWLSEFSDRGAGGVVHSGAALFNHRQCSLSQVGTYPDLTLDVARTS